MTINRAATGPRVLDDVRVLDFSGIIAGAYCTRMMADLGADVLKIEAPGGELMRHVAPMRGDHSTVFSALNSGKRCISLDLKKPEAVAICKRLVKRYDVVVENFSPGVMARLGLDFPTLRRENPALIMCSISGYGQTGPGAARPSFAPIVQAMSGFDLVTLDNQPDLKRPLNMGLPVADTTAAQQAFGATCAALYYRARTGIGQHIDIAMLDSLLSTMHRDFQAAFHHDSVDRLYGPLETQDGFVIMLPLSQRHFEELCSGIGRKDLLEDPRFGSVRSRLDNYNELMAETERWTRSRSSAEVLQALEKAHVPCAPYRSVTDAASDPQLAYRQMLTEIQDAAGPMTVPNSPFLYSETQAAVRPEVAGIGQHTAAVLRDELDFSTSEISELAGRGVVTLAADHA